MTAADGRQAGEYALCPAKTIDVGSLARFGAAVLPGPEGEKRILASWWRNASPECAVAAVHQSTGSVVGLCCGRPCQWVIDGKLHPAASICDWYVAPTHGGRLIGRRMLRSFEGAGRFLNGISISDVAVAYVSRMGWAGPYPSILMAMPVPKIARFGHKLVRDPPGLALEEHVIAGNVPLGTLGADLDRIEHARLPDGHAHMHRGADEWSWRMSIRPERVYRFCLARRNTDPVGYVVVRPMERAGKGMGPLRGALITDLVAAGNDRAVLRALAKRAVSMVAALDVGVALVLTTSRTHQQALKSIGFLSPDLPVLGRVLRRRAPVLMWSPRGPGRTLDREHVEMTFADSTMDFDL